MVFTLLQVWEGVSGSGQFYLLFVNPSVVALTPCWGNSNVEFHGHCAVGLLEFREFGERERNIQDRVVCRRSLPKRDFREAHQGTCQWARTGVSLEVSSLIQFSHWVCVRSLFLWCVRKSSLWSKNDEKEYQEICEDFDNVVQEQGNVEAHEMFVITDAAQCQTCLHMWTGKSRSM